MGALLVISSLTTVYVHAVAFAPRSRRSRQMTMKQTSAELTTRPSRSHYTLPDRNAAGATRVYVRFSVSRASVEIITYFAPQLSWVHRSSCDTCLLARHSSLMRSHENILGLLFWCIALFVPRATGRVAGTDLSLLSRKSAPILAKRDLTMLTSQAPSEHGTAGASAEGIHCVTFLFLYDRRRSSRLAQSSNGFQRRSQARCLRCSS